MLSASVIVAFTEHGGVFCRRHGDGRTHPLQLQSQKSDESSQHQSRIGKAQLPSFTRNCKERATTFSFGLMETGWESGGFGDRLRGMVTTYYLAIMTNSSFSVNWAKPYNLNDYFLVPSCVTHSGTKQRGQTDGSTKTIGLVEASSSKMSQRDKIVRVDLNSYSYFTKSLFSADIGKDVDVRTNSFHWKELVRKETFKQRAASLKLSNLSQAELFKLAIDELFGNPTSIVRETFKSVMRRLAGGEPNDVPYVGVQIRLGGKNKSPVGGWDDSSRHSLEQVECFAEEAVRLCRRMRVGSIFVTADSEEALRAFEDAVDRESAAACWSCPRPIVVQVPGTIAHTDKSYFVAREHAKDVWLKSIMDWWVLKHASALVISRSGFGETAAMASNAEAVLRLELPSATSARSKRGETSRCEFEDIFMHDRDVISSALFE